jgi:hypothetical protein
LTLMFPCFYFPWCPKQEVAVATVQKYICHLF